MYEMHVKYKPRIWEKINWTRTGLIWNLKQYILPWAKMLLQRSNKKCKCSYQLVHFWIVDSGLMTDCPKSVPYLYQILTLSTPWSFKNFKWYVSSCTMGDFFFLPQFNNPVLFFVKIRLQKNCNKYYIQSFCITFTLQTQSLAGKFKFIKM